MAPKQPGHGKQPDIVEHGDIYFLYRPKVDVDQVEEVGDVQRFQIILRPGGTQHFRLLTIGRKRLPDIPERERTWGFVDMIAESVDEIERELRESTYRTKTHGERTRPAARPAGEGIYALISADHRLFLAYELDLPETGGAVQSDLKIPPSASFALSVKNPEKPAPPDVGLRKDEVADYPKAVQREFRNRRFASEDGRMLDFEGAEFVIVGARLDPERELAIEFESDGTPDAVNILREHFQGRRSERWPHPVEPLIRGEWR